MARIPIHKVNVADGFTDDCEELIHRCLQVDILDYHVFCEIWKDMHFSICFQGRPSGAETAELSEEIMHIAKHYMVANPTNFQESVIGVYLVYALITMQPFPRFAVCRLVPEDRDAISTIEAEAFRTRRLDVLYTLGTILTYYAHYNCGVRQRGLESSYKKYSTESSTISHLGVRPKGVFYRQNEELDVIRELNVLGRKYSQIKSKIKNGKDRNLHYMDENMAVDLEKSIKKIISGIIYDERPDFASSEGSTNLAESIKRKAMKGIVKKMRHLESIHDRKNDPQELDDQSTASETETPANRKRKIVEDTPSRQRGAKKTKSSGNSSGSDDETMSWPSDIDDDDYNVSSDPEDPSDQETELSEIQLLRNEDLSVVNLEQTESANAVSDTKTEESIIPSANNDKTVIKTPNGDFYEIKVACENIQIIEDLTQVCKALQENKNDVFIETIPQEIVEEKEAKDSTKEHVFKAPQPLPKKKVVKKVINAEVKSKLKRIGMLSVADLDKKKK